ncbi:MAG: histidine phosphatase family protein [Bacteroidales bacterium]|nr:histidine phosphatase family protein [Bacteroidales bacterium]
MGKTYVTMIRHGETEWNIAMRLQGMGNSDLTEKGILQARQAAQILRHRHFDQLISSDLQRAVDTAMILNEYHQMELRTEVSLRERNFGIMEGLTREEIQLKYPDTYQGYMNRMDSYQIPEGESLIDFFARVTKGVTKISEECRGKKILIVTHGGVLDCMMRMIFDIPLTAPRKFSIYNASVNEFSYHRGEWNLSTWGNIEFQRGASQSIGEPNG